ncbi:hypothetical protein GCM10011415_40020 [Salipiger pallidus]|uniref:Uncharacterized protein n=1 Tax=Salipiger pallidus TaxID=1775170 RepID=A0A8J2ZNC2_9RHOB|nr:hypothetical protein [Salipiger pallidus]GGG85694.1 hypothetical protein GCM10011415_40020 [Salipiger pallidus]
MGRCACTGRACRWRPPGCAASATPFGPTACSAPPRRCTSCTAAALHQLHRNALTDYAELLGPGCAELLRTSGQLYDYDSDKA